MLNACGKRFSVSRFDRMVLVCLPGLGGDGDGDGDADVDTSVVRWKPVFVLLS